MASVCFNPHILWIVPFSKSHETDFEIHETKEQQVNEFDSKDSMFSSLVLCKDSSSVAVHTNWRPQLEQLGKDNKKEKKTEYIISLDYETLMEEAQQLVEASFHLSIPTYIIFDLRVNQQQPLVDNNNGMKMLLYMVNMIQKWRYSYKQCIFSIVVGSCSNSLLLSKWSLMINLVQRVEEKEFPILWKSLEKNIFLWKGALFIRSSSTWLGSGIIEITREEYLSNETRALWLFFRQLEPVVELEKLDTNTHGWHTITLPCEFRIDDQQGDHFIRWHNEQNTSDGHWFRITFRTQGGISRSCLLRKQPKQTTFEMHTIIPLTYPGYFGSIFAVVAKKIHAMALSRVLEETDSETDYRTTFTTTWKRHIQRMDGVADIQLFWHHPVSDDQSFQSLDQGCSKHLENSVSLLQSSSPLITRSSHCIDSQKRKIDEKHPLSSPSNQNGVVKRRKRALRKLSLRISQREYIDPSLSTHQDYEVEQRSNNHSISPQKVPSYNSQDQVPNDYRVDDGFVSLYNKVIKYWLSLLGQHFQLDKKEFDLLQYPLITSACDELYHSLAKTYHQVANQISGKTTHN
ncbi:hypothetical protein GpartN1_g7610.t1 [Galdieria partita]|uniref:Uncharacterized protein n=1 Tax=Galdieria partita TaxID=83374 RepID=A0A9C7UTW7_9RHOD|nr:hypothetical protein GpartN1_g7610.t1 [Galdieria partita]